MRCPACHSENLIITDSRDNSTMAKKRRRECKDCLTRFTTFEIIDECSLDPYVRGKIKKDLWRQMDESRTAP